MSTLSAFRNKEQHETHRKSSVARVGKTTNTHREVSARHGGCRGVARSTRRKNLYATALHREDYQNARRQALARGAFSLLLSLSGRQKKEEEEKVMTETGHESDRLPAAESTGFPLRMLKTKKGDRKREKCTRFNEDTILGYGNDEVIDSSKLAL